MQVVTSQLHFQVNKNTELVVLICGTLSAEWFIGFIQIYDWLLVVNDGQ